MESYKVAPDHSRFISCLSSNILKGPWWRRSSCEEIPDVDNLYLPALRAEMHVSASNLFHWESGTPYNQNSHSRASWGFQTQVSRPDECWVELFIFFKLVYVQTHHLMKFSTSSVWVSGLMSCINLEFTVAALLPYCVMDDSIYRLHTWLCK